MGFCRILLVLGLLCTEPWSGALSIAHADHSGHAAPGKDAADDSTGTPHVIPGMTVPLVLAGAGWQPDLADAAVRTVSDAFTLLLQHRADFPRFDESLNRNLLRQVVIEPRVLNRDGQEFTFLVARTTTPGRVKLLINAAALQAKDYLHHPDRLATALAGEFQWVVSKADTAPKVKTSIVERDLKGAPIRNDAEIAAMSREERGQALQGLIETYLKTVDEQKSLEAEAYYEEGTTTVVRPAQPDSTVKRYDLLVRKALHTIMQDPWFVERTPQAVRSLLNGKIWTVAFAKIDQRDWATRTRVLSEEKAVVVGSAERRIQPATVLINLHRRAAADDPFAAETKGLPMGALSSEQLAKVIALEIQQNIVEKSMTGHVLQDAQTAPK